MMTKEEGKLINLAVEVINRELGSVLDMAKSDGWATAPGGTDQDQEDARTAIELIRWLMEEAIIFHTSRGWIAGNDESEQSVPRQFRELLEGLNE